MLDLKKLPQYEFIREENLEGVHSKGIYLRHKKTGARVCLFDNKEDNKVFCIGFRTPPENHTGVPHIIEHTVLCGSERFPIKDPFQELVKSSLNTFLNAMTYDDKTIYPVASLNDKDFQNLMEVYLDAVFKPNIYKYEEIFMQEGWHYELEKKEDPITVNGVVYSEMKGAFSALDEHIATEMDRAFFPDNAYSNCSGGDPLHIPELTREYYLDFHKKHYHPSNSYIYLYGDMDMTEKLLFIDREYLSKYDRLEIDTQIREQQPFGVRDVVQKYPISSEDSEEKKTAFAYSTLVNEATFDPELRLAMDAIDYVLMAAPGAPLKQAILDAGIGDDISAWFLSYRRQPNYMIMAKNADKDQLPEFKEIIKNTLTDIVKKGLDKKGIEAFLNKSEFSYREAETGYIPKGLTIIDKSFESLLYDDDKPFCLIDLNETYKSLKAKLNTDYYEKLVEKYFINSNHAVYLTLLPEKGLTAKQDEELAKKLADYKASLSDAEIEKLIEKTAALKKYQSEGSRPEDIAKIPVLKREDIGKEPKEIVNEIHKCDDTEIVWHNLETNGIHYFATYYDMKKVPVRLIPYVGLLRDLLGMLDTDKHTYQELNKEIDFHTGGISTDIQFSPSFKKPGEYKTLFAVAAKALYGKMDTAIELMKEVISSTHYDSEKRIKELLSEGVSRLSEEIPAAGHRYGIGRVQSYVSEAGARKELFDGVGYYEFIKDLSENFDAKKEEIFKSLNEVAHIILRPENMIVSDTSTKEAFNNTEKYVRDIKSILFTDAVEMKEEKVPVEQKNEGLTCSARVQYVCTGANYKDEGFEYNGAINVLTGAVNNDSLYINVRIKGGAYGVFMNHDRFGSLTFASYRDPQLSKTLDAYNAVVPFIEGLNPSEEEMTKYVIGAIGRIDSPLSNARNGARSFAMYMSDVTMDDLKKERGEIINATAEDLRAFAPYIKAVLAKGNICVIGNEDKIKEEKKFFKEIKKL
jgi:Zn-dependent M16 (insulinase) family peptidase